MQGAERGEFVCVSHGDLSYTGENKMFFAINIIGMDKTC